ncbi:hypothetical protein U8335_20380 [Roseiconus lacunae]|uniref:hypothetical protein n=1 Tax=Roseiconus lacunae TaxID=2605694 RepID=UPI0030916020|nr:hypothetical protein U8335_20380 [Stieleria sp. HD01]
MSPISGGLASALDRLQAQVEKAEARLRKLPGSRHESASVELGDLKESDASTPCLEFGRIDGQDLECIKIVYYDGWGNQTDDNLPFLDLPISYRIQAATRIPTLVELAEAADSDLTTAAEHAASELEHFLSKND